jgi:hypothetical protein
MFGFTFKEFLSQYDLLLILNTIMLRGPFIRSLRMIPS